MHNVSLSKIWAQRHIEGLKITSKNKIVLYSVNNKQRSILRRESRKFFYRTLLLKITGQFVDEIEYKLYLRWVQGRGKRGSMVSTVYQQCVVKNNTIDRNKQ